MTTDEMVAELKTTWICLVRYRNIALKQADFQRATLYSNVIQDIADMITMLDHHLPPIPKDD